MMKSPSVSEIPALLDITSRIKSVGPTGFNAVDVVNYVENLWKCKQGDKVRAPLWMSLNDANAICSVVLAHREKVSRLGGEVEIKKVAEVRGSRFNTGKARFDLLDWQAMAGTAAVLEFGASKYSAYNWKKGLPYMEIIASTLRHIAAITRGEDIDSETGLPHADHIQCNGMFLSWMMKNRPDMDDRHKS